VEELTKQDGRLVPDWESEARAELRESLARIPSDEKLVLADGRIVGVMGRCGGAHDLDPTNKCMGLHDLETLEVIGVDDQAEVQPSTPGLSVAFRRLLADPAVRSLITDFIENAPPRVGPE
jgi:hypothetical protein